MPETWYRGVSTILAPSPPGGSLHDLGDGVYFTDSLEVAKTYASTRVRLGGGGKEKILSFTAERSNLGAVLDLTTDSRWIRYMAKPIIPGVANSTPAHYIKLANESYSMMFKVFIESNKIDLRGYDAVIGPEFVRGGKQLCLLKSNNSLTSAGAAIVSRLVTHGDTAPPKAGTPPIPSGFRGRIASIARNQAGMAVLGQALGMAIQALGEAGIKRQIDERLAGGLAPRIDQILNEGRGVLVIISIQEWIVRDFNDMRSAMLLSVSIHGGATMEEAYHAWASVDRLRELPPEGWRARDEYAWISPN